MRYTPEMSYERAMQWLERATETTAWGYLPGGTPRGEPTIWACAAGMRPPLSWLRTNDLEWSVLAAPAALSMWEEAAPLRETFLEQVLTMRGVTVENNTHVDGSLPGWSWFTGSFSWVEPTAFAVLSLIRCGQESHPRVKIGRDLIRDRVCVDGGWNYGNGSVLGKDLPSYHHSTGWALLALPKGDPFVAGGLKRLEQILETPSTLSLSVAALAAGYHGVNPTPWLSALRSRQAADGGFGLGRVDRTALAATALRMERDRVTPLTGPVAWPETVEGVTP